MRQAPPVEDYARMGHRAQMLAAELLQKQVNVLEQAATRRAEKQHARDTERDALYADAEKHRQRALARWHDGALLQRARLNEARAEMDQHTQNRTAA